MTEPWQQTVTGEEDRLDRWLHGRLSGYSIRRVRELIRAGRVSVNGRLLKKGGRVRNGDVVRVWLAGPQAPAGGELCPGPAPARALVVAYADEDLVILDKPPGMPTHPLAPGESGTLVNAALARFPELGGVGTNPLEPGLLHRLDAGTRGLVMFARNQSAFEFMRRELKMRRVGKFYRALVRGEMAPGRGEIALPLAHHPTDPSRMMAATGPGRWRGQPWPALTRFRVLATAGGVTLLELELVTGVMHQLRVHLALSGHPVLGDDLYGEPPRPGPRNYALQAARLCFTHPRTGAPGEARVGKTLELDDRSDWPELPAESE